MIYQIRVVDKIWEDVTKEEYNDSVLHDRRMVEPVYEMKIPENSSIEGEKT